MTLSPAALPGAAQWSSTNVQYLYSDHYRTIERETGAFIEERMTLLTLEHANGWRHGDNFYFVTVDNPNRNGGNTPTGYYGELSPRLSIGKLRSRDLAFGIVKDVLLSGTVEMGQGFHNYLYGIAVDLDLAHMPLAQINYYVRNDIGSGTSLGQQITLVWMKPFTLGNARWVFEGFLDYAFARDHAENTLNTSSRLLMDLGTTWGNEGVLQLGIEYKLGRNKFGIAGVHEDAPQAVIKWIW